jgi:hypothetical protein
VGSHVRFVASLFQVINQNKNITPKMASMVHANGGHAITINARASQANAFRGRKNQRRRKHGEITTIASMSPAPE